MCTAPNCAAARVGAAPPLATMSCSEPMGASTIGRRNARPNSLALASTFSTLRSTRGRNARESIAIRLRM